MSFFFPSPLQIPGKKNKLRVYYLSWLRNKILRNDPEVEKRQGWVSVGDLEGCVHYKVGKVFFFFFFPLKSCLIVLLHLVTPAFFFSCISKLYRDCFETCLLNMMDALALVIPDCT